MLRMALAASLEDERVIRPEDLEDEEGMLCYFFVTLLY